MAVSGATPVLVPPSSMKVQPGATSDQTIHATDSGGDPLTFLKGVGPDFMIVTTLDPGVGSATGLIHLEPLTSAQIGIIPASIVVSDGVLSDEKSFTIVSSDNPPLLSPPLDMRVEGGRTADQALSATDEDGDALTFSLALGPWFASVTTTGPQSGNLHLTPTLADSGFHAVSVSVSDGIAIDVKTLGVLIPSVTTPILAPVQNMSLQAGQSSIQNLYATDFSERPLYFYEVEGPSYMSVGTYGTPGRTGYGYVAVSPQRNDSPTPAGGTVTSVARVGVTNGTRSDTTSFTLSITFPADHPPVLQQPEDMTVQEGLQV